MNGKQLAVVLAFIGAAAMLLNNQTSSKVSEFDAWKARHGVVYTSTFENAYRERVFLQNLAKVEAHNADKTQTYTQGLNQFSALTQEEFTQQYLGFIGEASNVDAGTTTMGDIDWKAAGAVTGVKNQGQCGSCWAFSTTGGLEGLSFLKGGSLQSFSESQLVDCSGSYGNQACNGGLMTNALKFVKDKGIVNEDDYPYKAVKQACKIATGPYKVSGMTEIKTCDALASTLANMPVSVAVDASNWSPYKTGVFSNCGTRLNHGVTLIGSNGGNWVVKNSWGPAWGESGYIRLVGGKSTCGICNMAVIPLK